MQPDPPQQQEYCQEVDADKVLALAEEMVARNVDFKYFQNYFLHPQSSLLQGKTPEEIKAFVRGPLYNKLRDLGDVLGFRQGYLRPGKRKKG